MDVKTDAMAASTPRPGAPALEKGLDVLELLAAEAGGLTQKQIAEGVGRSVGEIFRMLGVLEQRGYVVRDRRTGDYALTLQLFRLATQYPPTRRLQQAALPIMEALAASNNLSCHLSVLNGSSFLVVATAEPDWPMGWTVKLGAVFPLSMEYASARVLAAFQHETRRAELANIIARHDKAKPSVVLAAIATIVSAGGDFSSTELDHGVTSLSCPVLESSGRAAAAFALGLLAATTSGVDEAAIAARLRDAARQISGAIGAPTEAMTK